MPLTKAEIAEQLTHQREMLTRRQRNLRKLELQEADYGINVPLDLANQIDRLTSQIEAHKAEIDRLETLAVEGALPLAEVEYQVALAEAWSSPNGRPTVVSQMKLEFQRLRLHITPKRSKELEIEVRSKLAQEWYERNFTIIFTDAFIDLMKWIHQIDTGDSVIGLTDDIFDFSSIARFQEIISLWPRKAFDIIKEQIGRNVPFSVNKIEMLLDDNPFFSEHTSEIGKILVSEFGERSARWSNMVIQSNDSDDDDIPF